MNGKAWRVVVPVLIAGLLAILPVPEGLTPNAWYYFAIFAAVVERPEGGIPGESIRLAEG